MIRQVSQNSQEKIESLQIKLEKEQDKLKREKKINDDLEKHQEYVWTIGWTTIFIRRCEREIFYSNKIIIEIKPENIIKITQEDIILQLAKIKIELNQ